MNPSSKSAFTLLELSIVLVIIGLIAGGVLVGADLIKAATIRATVQQIERYEAAMRTFQTKYNGLPGDLLPGDATAIGFLTGDGTAGHGDNNGFIDSCSTQIEYFNNPRQGDSVLWLGCETELFWSNMSQAGLISENFRNASACVNSHCTTAGKPDGLLPPAKLGRGIYFTIFNDFQHNYFQLSTIVNLNFLGMQLYNLNYSPYQHLGLTPLEAYSIDTKMDDGLPETGIVQFVWHTQLSGIGTVLNSFPFAFAPSDTICDSNIATPSVYNIQRPYGDIPNCGLRIEIN